MPSTKIRIEVLSIELAKRGWNSSDLARAARVSPATVSAAFNGRPVSARTLVKVAVALQRQPAVAAVEALIAAEGPAAG